MYNHWWSYMTGEMFVLLLVVFTLWALNRGGIYEWWIDNQFDYFPHMHLPTEARLYRSLGYDIAMQVFFAMVAFFLITFTIVASAVHKEHQWQTFEQLQR